MIEYTKENPLRCFYAFAGEEYSIYIDDPKSI